MHISQAGITQGAVSGAVPSVARMTDRAGVAPLEIHGHTSMHTGLLVAHGQHDMLQGIQTAVTGGLTGVSEQLECLSQGLRVRHSSMLMHSWECQQQRDSKMFR